MIGFLAFLNPITILLVVNFLVVLYYNYYSKELIILFTPLVIVSIIVTVMLRNFLILRIQDVIWARQSISLNHLAWKLIAIIIIISGILELAFFGIPMLGQVSYVKFGFPLLHHMAVSSWLLIFINFPNKYLNSLVNIYAFLFPLLIFNRDVFLLTVICYIFRMLMLGRLKWIHFIIGTTLFALIFSAIGGIRSGNVNELINLPLNFNINYMNPVLFWIFIYTTVPSFNLHHNTFYDSGRDLYDPLLTVFPEYYKLMEIYSFSGLYIYLLIGGFAIILPRLTNFPGWMCFSLFFYYQFIMGCIFSNKLLNTHTLFVFLIIFLVFLTRQAIKSINRQIV